MAKHIVELVVGFLQDSGTFVVKENGLQDGQIELKGLYRSQAPVVSLFIQSLPFFHLTHQQLCLRGQLVGNRFVVSGEF